MSVTANKDHVVQTFQILKSYQWSNTSFMLVQFDIETQLFGQGNLYAWKKKRKNFP